ncbi:MAG: hypothetical protein COV44_02925 [Deltaproteobacteria bacterium CG11_big_fil_rev_8_21_14_0_20_45_16]|nr:MAG: hypothetical protein COV44_02925 [Deltaproteobacteria bacterium CG11_big_fil_rev_8_21_14_0_20_45_16]
MDEVTEGLKGLDALAKLVVCTIGLFCIPIITRKYAQNLGLSAGQAIMSKAFYAAQFAGLPMLGKSALAQTSRGVLSQSKDWIASSGKKALIGGEKFAKRVAHPSFPSDHPKLQSYLEDKSIKSQMMKEKGVLPWTSKDERKLAKSKNPQEVKAFSHQRQQAHQFESSWDKMKSLQHSRSDLQSNALSQSQTSWNNQIDRSSPAASSFGHSRPQQNPQGFAAPSIQLSAPIIPRSEPTVKTAATREQTYTPSANASSTGRRSSTPANRSNSPSYLKPSVPDLYSRYQQIKNQKRTWIQKEKK